MTIKEIRKKMRALTPYQDTLIIPGFGQIKKGYKSYSLGPLPENDTSNCLDGFVDWSFDVKEKIALDLIRKKLGIQ